VDLRREKIIILCGKYGLPLFAGKFFFTFTQPIQRIADKSGGLASGIDK
jgi:hypothetical protein